MSKHAYDLKTTSRKHANKHIIRPQLTDSIVQKFFWVLGKTPRSWSTISYSWSSSLDHMRQFSSHGQSFLNHGQDLLNLGKFVSVLDELSVGLPYSLSLSPSKMKLGGESFIYILPKISHTAPPAATCPDSCRTHRRHVSRAMAWRQVATGVTPPPHQLRLQDSADFGSKVGDLGRKAPRVRCLLKSVPWPAGQTTTRPTFPIFANSCPFFPIFAL